MGPGLVLMTQAICLPPGIGEYSPICLPPAFMTPERATATAPPPPPGDPPRPAGRSGPSSYEVTAFAPGPGAHETLCAPSKSGVSVSPSPVELLQSSPAGLHSQMFWGLLLLMPDPQPDVGLRALIPVRELLWYNYSPVCGSPIQGVWDLIVL